MQTATDAHRRGDLTTAERSYRRLLRTQPQNADLHSVLGIALLQQQKFAQAALAYAKSVSLDPTDPDRRTDLLRALRLGEQIEEGLVATSAALLEVTPTPALFEEAAKLYLQAGRFDETVGLVRRAMQTTPDNAVLYRTLGAALMQQQRHPEAIAAFEKALECDPTLAEAHHDLGLIHCELGNFEDAGSALLTACELAPDSIAYLSNLAMVRTRQARFDEAIAYYDQALAIAPDTPQMLYNQAFPLLGKGDLARGWEQYAYGFQTGHRQPNREFVVPRWEGPGSAGRRLLIWREQGVGDDIRMASCFDEVIAAVDSVVIETDPRLVSLYTRSFPRAEIRAEQATFDHSPDYDRHCPTHDLPALIRSGIDSYSRPGGWLRADPELVQRMAARVAQRANGRLRVGICWRSMSLETHRLVGYTTLEEWAPVLQTEGIEFFNLQYGEPEMVAAELQQAERRNGTRVHYFEDIDYTNDFETVAALMENLDVVVSVGTSVALLAAALARPLLYLIPEGAALQFGQAYEPWMPSATVLSRLAHENWEKPMLQAAALLQQRR